MSMKSAEEWQEDGLAFMEPNEIYAIQKDALRHAAELCRAGGRSEDYENAQTIEAEADKLEKP